MFGLGTTELLLIFGSVFLLFGAKRLPGLARSMGESVRGFRKALSDKTLSEKGHREKGPESPT